MFPVSTKHTYNLKSDDYLMLYSCIFKCYICGLIKQLMSRLLHSLIQLTFLNGICLGNEKIWILGVIKKSELIEKLSKSDVETTFLQSQPSFPRVYSSNEFIMIKASEANVYVGAMHRVSHRNHWLATQRKPLQSPKQTRRQVQTL